VLRNLPEDDQNLMKVFRKQPIKAYEIKVLMHFSVSTSFML
jgi:hypothetical protein